MYKEDIINVTKASTNVATSYTSPMEIIPAVFGYREGIYAWKRVFALHVEEGNVCTNAIERASEKEQGSMKDQCPVEQCWRKKTQELVYLST